MTPSDTAANTTSAFSMWLRAKGVICDPNVMPTPTQTRLPPPLTRAPQGSRQDFPGEPGDVRLLSWMLDSVADGPLTSNLCVGSELRSRRRDVSVLVRTLTYRAPVCRGMGFQALTLDRLSAAYADTIRAERYALQRALDR